MLRKILIVDDDSIFRESLVSILNARDFDCDQAENGRQALKMVQEHHYDVVVSDLEMPEMDGLQLMEKSLEFAPQIFFIVVTAYGTMERAITALRKGAYDFIVKPFKFEGLIIRIEKLLEHKMLQQENIRLRREIHRQNDFSSIIGESAAMKEVFRLIEKIADSESNIFINGKSGTGKELAARAIHYSSRRKNHPFIGLNCSAVPENLIESELFGYRRGAFTGANQDYAGLFMQAQSGTLFLDEVGEISANFQMKLLRAIEQKEIMPLGASKPLKVNVRIISATNKDLEKEIENRRFREDLYYRLNVITVRMPSLAERRSDIPLLVNHFIHVFNKELGKNIQGMTRSAMNILKETDWRGEVRELENVIERAMIFCDGSEIDPSLLPDYLLSHSHSSTSPLESEGSLDDATKQFQRQYIMKILQKFNKHRGKTAKFLKISEPTLYRRLQELNII